MTVAFTGSMVDIELDIGPRLPDSNFGLRIYQAQHLNYVTLHIVLVDF